MADRAYTVAELDALREACEMRWLFGTTHPRHMKLSFSYRPEEKAIAVEQRVRTYMIAGITAAHIYAEDAPKVTP